MKQKFLWMLVAILFVCGTVSADAQSKNERHAATPSKKEKKVKSEKKDTPYFSSDELPNACVYLPAPPDTASLLFVDDFQQFLWGKSMRSTPRGKQASWESLYGTSRMATVFGEALGMTISKEETPAIWRFMKRAGETGNKSTSKAKRKYMRVRPFVRKNEHVASEFDNENDLRHNGSYPSGHTGHGWGTALALAEMAPEYQDTILRRGFEYGQSRVIVGAHWQSDVDAAYLTASAAFARMHTSPEYQADLEEARAEYRRIKGIKSEITEVGYPKGEKILDAPADTSSYRFYGDVVYYWQTKRERDTGRGKQALADAACEEKDFFRCFTPSVGVTLGEEETPAIAALMKKTFEELCNASTRMKSTRFRKRPFVQFGERSVMPESNDYYTTSSSYPSSHSILGWGIALALVEVAPNCQDAILTRGYEYGRSRAILGFHYASDIQAGRIVAACTLVRLHNDPVFQQLMEAAREEYNKVYKDVKKAPVAHVSPDSSEDFVNLTDVVPDAILEIRYFSTYNFVGARIDGYEEPTALLTRRAADSLRAVSDDLKAHGYRLKIYDAYRPQCAVDHFMRWGAAVNDTLMKPYFYPDLDKKVLFPLEYICERSGHTRGSTLDLTLFDMATEKELDMGGTFDWFGPESHPDFCGNPENLDYTGDNHKSPANRSITSVQFYNRMVLRRAMMRHGFKPFDTEWWHFTLADEPYPDTYFTFPVKRLK
ncbi:MAG: phosphatase PAP2 family protein [Bacteroidaceae bacterium]|nr:phosphatase PAP2 family protein [Bacteroidaceae bacterium]